MKRIFALSAIVVLMGVTRPGSAEAGGFDNKSLKGAFGFSASGIIVAPNPLAGPAVAVGIFTGDGAGGCSISDTINVAVLGIVARTTISCTYSVNPDGTGTITPTFGPPFGVTPSSFVIVDKENEFRFIRTTSTVRISGVAKP